MLCAVILICFLHAQFIQSEKEWERDVAEAGDGVLCICDIYNPLWGPCEMAANVFSNLFYDEGENYSMRFVRADASKVTALMEFRDQCMPVFAFYKGGEQVAKVEGADIVKIKNLIFEKAPKPA